MTPSPTIFFLFVMAHKSRPLLLLLLLLTHSIRPFLLKKEILYYSELFYYHGPSIRSVSRCANGNLPEKILSFLFFISFDFFDILDATSSSVVSGHELYERITSA